MTPRSTEEIPALLRLIRNGGVRAAELAAARSLTRAQVGRYLAEAVRTGRIVIRGSESGATSRRITYHRADDPALTPPPPAAEPSWVRAERQRQEAAAAEIDRTARLLAAHPASTAADLARRLGHVGPAASKGGEPRPLPATAIRHLEALEAAGRAAPLDPPSAGYARRWAAR